MKPADSDIMERLAREIKAARKKHRISVADAAVGIGISTLTLQRIENGKTRNGSGLTLMKILSWAGDLGYAEFAGFKITRPTCVQGEGVKVTIGKYTGPNQ